MTIDPDPAIDPRAACSCDNCFYHHTQLAASVIAMREALTQIAKRALGLPHDHTVIP